MRIDLHRTLEKIEENLPKDKRITFEILEKAYQQTLWLRSDILAENGRVGVMGAYP